jgi:hypothetical protein
MPGDDVVIGPFVGGLNTASDPTSIGDNEVADISNFDIDFDGSLVSRPPITTGVQGPVSGQNCDIIGIFVDATNGQVYVIGSTNNEIFYFNAGAWTSITTGFRASAAIQYLDKMWIVAEPGSTSNGGQWSPSFPFAAVATMPKGQSIQIYKERLWIGAGLKETVNSSRMYFSAIADGTTWAGVDFIDVNKGDGQKLVDIYSLSNNLYVFKEDSTYVFSYDSAPTKGNLQPVSKVVGTSNLRCIVQYENILYVYHEGFVYELINYNYTKLNVKVDFTSDTSLATSYFRPVAMSVIGDRIILRYFEMQYVFYIKLRAWSKWESSFVVGRWWKLPKDINSNFNDSYTTHSYLLNNRAIYNLYDGFDLTKTETYTCYIKTKIYDFDTPTAYKRLYWWGIDLLGQGNVVAKVTPVVYSSAVTWGNLAARTWGSLLINTWGQPLVKDNSVSETIPIANNMIRKLVKSLKALRFRSIFFEVTMSTTGTILTAPCKLFKIIPLVKPKSKVAKKVN